MSDVDRGWACWREPGAKKAFFLEGQVEPLTKLDRAGFVVHPFEDLGGYFISGIAQPYATRMPEGLDLHPGDAYPQDSYDDYILRLNALIGALAAGQAEKVVFSRRKHLERAPFSAAEAWAAFNRVAEVYPQAFVSLVSVPGLGCWMAATPEVLCRQTDQGFYTMALAGTRSQTDPDPWHAKEYREQGLVVESIQAQLQQLGVGRVQVEGPKEVEAGLLRHLRSDFYFQGDKDLFEVAKALHPTPAVGGLPRNEAAELIDALELSPRGLYAGYVGYVAPGEPASLYVHLRCACLSSPQPTLFAGGGILADSDPEAEWQETEYKLQVLYKHLA